MRRARRADRRRCISLGTPRRALLANVNCRQKTSDRGWTNLSAAWLWQFLGMEIRGINEARLTDLVLAHRHEQRLEKHAGHLVDFA